MPGSAAESPGDAIEGLFYQYVRKLAKEEEIQYEEVFIDGTKIESMANRYTFVWRKSVEKQLAKVKEKWQKSCSGNTEGTET